MRNLKFIVAYDGTNYHGFQRQKNALAVQQVIEEALSNLINEPVKINAASRTDAGVHAQGQVFNCRLNSPIPSNRFPIALNTKLPDDIIIVDTSEVADDFHARYHTKNKVYYYQIYNNDFPSPFLRNYTYHIYNKLDLKAMKDATKYLVGEYDFSSFRSAGCNAQSPIRKIFNIDIKAEDKLITIRIKGNGFLYNMVRIIIGTLVEVGLAKKRAATVKEILLAKDRRRASPTAPAKGLVLEKINY